MAFDAGRIVRRGIRQIKARACVARICWNRSYGLNFTAAGFLPLPEITAIGFTTPLLIVVFASIMLGERVGVYRISAVLVGLIGVLIIVEPRLTLGEMDAAQDAMMLGVILAITAAACAALAQIQIRKMVQVERTSAIIFYFCITASVFP